MDDNGSSQLRLMEAFTGRHLMRVIAWFHIMDPVHSSNDFLEHTWMLANRMKLLDLM